MSTLSFESQMAGMPSGKKKTRRGGRGRSKGPVGNPDTHMKAVQAALAADDHATAKTHAFALMRSLHAKAPGEPKAIVAPSAPMLAPAASAPSPAAIEPGEDPARAQRARLAKVLHGLGK